MQTERLAQLVERKREVLFHLRALGVRQLELVDTDDWSQLTKVLSTKQRLLGLLSDIERELAPFRNEAPHLRTWASDAARDKCRQDADECATLLNEVMQLERDGERAMVRRRDEAARQLSGMHNSVTARHAYIVEHAPSSIGLDLVSEG
jgi:hypothetical protein